MYKILIVDDERNERTGIEKLIRRFHYDLDVRQASNGKEALCVLQKEPVDVLLTDIKMPFMTGMELIENVHKNGWNPICVIYSAYGEFEYAQNAIALGVRQYLLKPIKLQEFQKLFDEVISICDEKEKLKAKNEELKQKLKNVENERMYRQLLRYLESESKEIHREVEDMFLDNSFVPIILSSYSYLFSRYWENYENELHKIFGERTHIINKDDTQTLLLVRYDDLLPGKKAAQLCEKVIEMSKSQYQSDLFIIVGDRCKNIWELRTEYEKMREQLDYQFFITESTYFLKDDNGFIKKKSDMLSLYFEKITTCARLEDFVGMKSEFDKAFEYVEKNVGFSSIYIKYNFSEVIKHCCEILHDGERMIKVVEDIYGSRSINQVKNAVFHLIDVLSESSTSKKEENRVVVMAKAFIHNHYQDCTLSVSSVADELDISAAYLSSMFKMETNQNMVRYISGYRMEKAKELLTTTNMKVGDIAERVGYVNTSYFISLFRNNTGCSPAKYRERVFRDE